MQLQKENFTKLAFHIENPGIDEWLVYKDGSVYISRVRLPLILTTSHDLRKSGPILNIHGSKKKKEISREGFPATLRFEGILDCQLDCQQFMVCGGNLLSK
jgi:hypothetical protein